MNRMPHFYLLLFLCLSALPSCSIGSDYTAQDRSEAKVAWEKISSGALLLDVRTGGEYRSGHIEGALNIPHNQIKRRLGELGDNKEQEIVLYCRSGRRSAIAEEILRSNGYTNVLNAGGYERLNTLR